MRKILILVCSFGFFFSSAGQSLKGPVILSEIYKDESGNIINAHGAGVLEYGDEYFLFGEIKKGNTRLVPGQNWEDYRVPAGGISCYSSRDLVNWKYRGIALSPVTGDSASDLDTGRVIERPKVIFNKKTGKFIMWMHVDKNDYSYARAGVAESDRPEGPYRYLGSVRPNGQESRDMTIFKDDDEKAYLIYASEHNNTMQICLLSDDYLKTTGKFIRVFVNGRREAPAIFKNNGSYFLITSLCTGWSPNAAVYAVSDHVMGDWKELGNPCTGKGAETTFDSQSTFVLPLKNKENEFLFMADRWIKTDLPDSRYIWLPFSVRKGRLEIEWPSNK